MLDTERFRSTESELDELSKESGQAKESSMGKASRLKRERAKRTQPTVVQAPVDLLYEAVLVVGNIFGDTPNCADAAALLQLIAAHLGYELTPRPVAVLGRHLPSGVMIIMGPAARAVVPPDVLNDVDDRLPGGKDTGHLVLTSTDPMRLYDPNIRQLGSYGVSAPSVVMRISDINDSTKWSIDRDGLQVQYILDETNRALLPQYERAHRSRRAQAATIAAHLRAGKTGRNDHRNSLAALLSDVLKLQADRPQLGSLS